MFKSLIVLVLLIIFFPQNVKAESFTAIVDVDPTSEFTISPNIWGMNAAETWPVSRDYYFLLGEEVVYGLGIKQLRFPPGCSADSYDWKEATMHYIDSQWGEIEVPTMSVDEALSFAEEIGATLKYTVNITSIDHTNSCGITSLHRGTIEEATELVRTYKNKIRHYEIGNEQFAGNWTPDQYTQIALQFAQAMKAEDPTIELTLVGYPTNRENDPNFIDWNNALEAIKNQTCSGVSCFDYISDHIYTSAGYRQDLPETDTNFPGLLAFYPKANLEARIASRNALYAPLSPAITEWNLVCWENRFPVSTVEHGIFTAETLMLMAEHDIKLAHLYALNYGDVGNRCGISDSSTNGEINALAQAFSFTSALSGNQKLITKVTSPNKIFNPSTNCNVGDCFTNTQIPYLSAISTYSETLKKFQIIISNKHENQSAMISLFFSKTPNIRGKMATIETLYASDYKDKTFLVKNDNLKMAMGNSIEVPPISLTKIEILMEAIPADGNFDFKIDGLDYVIWLNNYQTTTNEGAKKGDYNSDGVVDGRDYVVWVNHYNL